MTDSPKRLLTAVAILVLVLVVPTVAVGCSRGPVWGDTGDTCRCPILIETAPMIDFIGDGQAPVRVVDGSAPGPRPLLVGLEYATAYSDETVIEIAERFIDAGYVSVTPLELPLRQSPRFVEDDWEVVIGGVTRDGVDRVRVVVHIVEPDRDAVETLAPLAEALGTIP